MSFLSRFFPPPRYFGMPAFGVDLSDCSVKYAELVSHKDALRLGVFGTMDIPGGAIEKGEIKQRDVVTGILRELRDMTQKNYVVAALPEERVYMSVMPLPMMRAEELATAIESQLEEYIPMPAHESIFDFEFLGADPIEHQYRVAVSAAPRTLINAYVELFSMAGFRPLAFEIEVQALARAVVPRGDMRTMAILDFGKTRTGLAIVQNGIVQFATTVPIGGYHLEQSLREQLGVDTAEARRIKIERGLQRSEDHNTVFDALLPLVSALKDETEKHIIFWNTRPKTHKHQDVETILLAGGDANLIGFEEYLASQLKLPVSRANPWVNIASFEKYIPEIHAKEAITYAPALGLALRAHGSIKQ